VAGSSGGNDAINDVTMELANATTVVNATKSDGGGECKWSCKGRSEGDSVNATAIKTKRSIMYRWTAHPKAEWEN